MTFTVPIILLLAGLALLAGGLFGKEFPITASFTIPKIESGVVRVVALIIGLGLVIFSISLFNPKLFNSTPSTETVTTTTTIPTQSPTVPPKEIPDVVSDTSWNVRLKCNGSSPFFGPPWVFYADHTLDAGDVWHGTWKPTTDGYQVELKDQKNNPMDNFIVKFDEDGEKFTAYKKGEKYRCGERRH